MKHPLDENKTYIENVKAVYGEVFTAKELKEIAMEIEGLICDDGLHPDYAIDQAIGVLGLMDRIRIKEDNNGNRCKK